MIIGATRGIAWAEAEPGDVVVIANDGYTRTVVFGDIQPNSPAMNGPGIADAPVTLGDVHVEPDDIIVGDADGVVVVPAAHLRSVLDRLAQVRAAEARTIALVEQGATMAAGALRVIEKAVIINN
jgi:regulator of RNase E activity RraA